MLMLMSHCGSLVAYAYAYAYVASEDQALEYRKQKTVCSLLAEFCLNAHDSNEPAVQQFPCDSA